MDTKALIIIAAICIIAYFVFIKKKDTPQAVIQVIQTQPIRPAPREELCEPNSPLTPACLKQSLLNNTTFVNAMNMSGGYDKEELNSIRNKEASVLFNELYDKRGGRMEGKSMMDELQENFGRPIATVVDFDAAITKRFTPAQTMKEVGLPQPPSETVQQVASIEQQCGPNEPISQACVRYVIMSSLDFMNVQAKNDDFSIIRNMSDEQLFATLKQEIVEMQRRQNRPILTNQDLRDALNASAK